MPISLTVAFTGLCGASLALFRAFFRAFTSLASARAHSVLLMALPKQVLNCSLWNEFSLSLCLPLSLSVSPLSLSLYLCLPPLFLYLYLCLPSLSLRLPPLSGTVAEQTKVCIAMHDASSLGQLPLDN